MSLLQVGLTACFDGFTAHKAMLTYKRWNLPAGHP